jgi:CheY-like chemotaxis protein
MHDYEKVARELGAIGYALKPVKREQLVEAFRLLEDQLSRKVRSLLIIEDDAVQRDAIANLLKADEVNVVAVGTAEEGLTQLRSSTFDCCVLDLWLPGISGFDLLERMSSDAASSFPPVIVYTARPLSPEDEQRLRRLSSSIIVKGARSPERLLEEVTLFLHQVEADLPPERQRMLRAARDREKIFEGRRVLLVEDDVRTVFALTRTLEPKGLSVEIARNGKEALARIAAEPGVDLVLMDIMMPEMDGLTAMRKIRTDDKWRSVPILALTAKAMPDDRLACLEAGANDYIVKPIDVEKLMSLLRVWMPR